MPNVCLIFEYNAIWNSMWGREEENHPYMCAITSTISSLTRPTFSMMRMMTETTTIMQNASRRHDILVSATGRDHEKWTILLCRLSTWRSSVNLIKLGFHCQPPKRPYALEPKRVASTADEYRVFIVICDFGFKNFSRLRSEFGFYVCDNCDITYRKISKYSF